MMQSLLLVGLGGAAGSMLRFLCQRWWNHSFPYGTLAVNLAGCFLNAPAADLVGKIGYAARLFHGEYGEDNNFGDRCGIGTGTHWEIFSLCCGDRGCSSGET